MFTIATGRYLAGRFVIGGSRAARCQRRGHVDADSGRLWGCRCGGTRLWSDGRPRPSTAAASSFWSHHANRSIFAARIKSDSVKTIYCMRPRRDLDLAHRSRMSDDGLFLGDFATRFTNARADLSQETCKWHDVMLIDDIHCAGSANC